MKKQLAILALTFLGGSLSAQTSMLHQFLYKHILGQPVVYDSISVRSDSTDLSQVFEAYSIYRNSQGNLDSMQQYDLSQGKQIFTYQGNSLGGNSEITEYYIDNDTLRPGLRTTFHGGETRPTKISWERYGTNGFEDMVRFDVIWRNSQQIERLDMYAALGPGHFFYYGTVQFEYDQNTLRQVVTYDDKQQPVEMEELQYQNGRVSAIERFENLNGQYLQPTAMFKLKYSPQNLFYEMDYYQHSLDSVGYNYEFTYRFEKKKSPALKIPHEYVKVELGLYPNPTSDFLNLTGEVSEEAIYVIVNTAGRVVMRGKCSKVIKVQHLKPGTYTLQVRDGRVKQSAHFIVKR